MKNKINKDSFISIGKILTTQGSKGELRVMPLTDFPERFKKNLEVYIEGETGVEKHKILSARFHNKWLILSLDGITDMNLAEKFRNSMIKIPLEHITPLPEGSHYVFQLVGLPVYIQEGQYLGDIKDIFQTGSNDVYQVIHPETNQETLIPAIKECVQSIDLIGKKIVVRLLPGLMD